MTNAIANVEKEAGLTIDPMVDMMERALRDPSVNAEKLGQLLELANNQRDRERLIAKEDDELDAKRSFMRAFKRVKAELPQIVKDAHNSQTRSDYATAEMLDAAITPIMTKHGFFISFVEGETPRDENHMHIIGLLGHEDGHEREYPTQVPIAGIGMKGSRMMTTTHGYGATKTYGRRYTKLDIWDIAVMDKDSDGNANNWADSEKVALYRDRCAAAETLSDFEDISSDIVKDTSMTGVERTEIGKIWAVARKPLLREASNA